MVDMTVISVQTKVLPSNDPMFPPLVLQVTKMVNTYMLWIGISSTNDVADGDRVVSEGKLCKDWACAMPPRTPTTPPAATSLFRSSNADVALSMAQRLGLIEFLAKRFKKQIFLSVDLPLGLGQGQHLVLEAEKGILEYLKTIENMDI